MAALFVWPHVAARAAPVATPAPKLLCEEPGAASVNITLIGSSERRTATREVLGELLEGHVTVSWRELASVEISAEIRQASADDLALAHVYVDLREAPLLVYIGDRGHVRVLIRRVALPASFDEAAREEVGAIVASAIDALCAGGTIGVVRLHPSEEAATPVERQASPRINPTPPVRHPATRRNRWSGGVLARYQMMAWAPKRVQHALELGAALTRRFGRVDPQAALWVGWLAPSAVTPVSDSPRLVGALLRAELGMAVRWTPRWSQLAALGAGVDGLRVAGQGGRWFPLPIVQASVGVRAAVGRGVVAELQAHVAVDLVDTRVLAATDGRVLFDPWRVRPGISLTFGWLSPR